ncbi:MAG: hypothetical protein MUO26_00280 [Methanotrichaceae archaeon]|nr:hypothetical protein [Methanotrichaceae archaeon]
MELPLMDEFKFPAEVIKVIDSRRVVINRGDKDGILVGQRFLIYEIGENLIDPVTKGDLGRLEIVKGIGIVSHLQPKIATISSDMKRQAEKRVIKRETTILNFSLGRGPEEEIVEYPIKIKPFDDPKVGDKAKPI